MPSLLTICRCFYTDLTPVPVCGILRPMEKEYPATPGNASLVEREEPLETPWEDCPYHEITIEAKGIL